LIWTAGLDQTNGAHLCTAVANNSPDSMPRTSSAKVEAIQIASTAAEKERANIVAMTEAASKRVLALKQMQAEKETAEVATMSEAAAKRVAALKDCTEQLQHDEWEAQVSTFGVWLLVAISGL
jgi:Xaa-Pro aminopeptidase